MFFKNHQPGNYNASRGQSGRTRAYAYEGYNPEFCLPGKGSPVTYLWQGFMWMNTENVEINTSLCPRVDNMDKGSRLLKAKTSKNTWLQHMKIHTWIFNTWHVSRILHAYFMGTSYVFYTQNTSWLHMFFEFTEPIWTGGVPWLPIGCSALGLNHLCEPRGAYYCNMLC